MARPEYSDRTMTPATRRGLREWGIGLAVLAVAGPALAQPATPRAPASPPATEIYLAPMRFAPDGPQMGPARNATDNPKGYDNQPFFGPDGRTLLFASARGGTQTDIYFLELQTRQVRQFTSTPESEYSPTVTPDEAGVSVIRVEADGTQRLWRFAEGGAAPVVLAPAIKPVGYHAWIDGTHVAVFVLGAPATLQVVDLTTGKADVVARDIGRSLARRPRTGTISFVHRDGGRWLVKDYDPVTKSVLTLVEALDGSADRDTAWGPDGTLFMTRGAEVHYWRPGQAGWRLLSTPDVGPLSRLAVSRDGRWMALVVAEAGQ